MRELLLGLGVAAAIEGTLYALFPGGMRRMMGEVFRQSDTAIRVAAIGALAVGVILVWIARG